jgi:hypothetical protein
MTSALALLALAVGFTAGMCRLAWLVATELDEMTGMSPMPPELPDAGRDGVDFKTAYDAGRQFPDGAGFAALIDPFHDHSPSPEASQDHVG